MRITKKQLQEIIEEELDEIRLRIPLPRWAAKYATNAPKEEEPVEVEPEPEETPEEGPEEKADDGRMGHRPRFFNDYVGTAKERRDQRSQEIGSRKEAERAARKAKRRAEMGITESQLKQIIREEFESMVDEGFWPWQTKQNKKKPSVMWTDPKTGKNYWLPPDDPRVKKADKKVKENAGDDEWMHGRFRDVPGYSEEAAGPPKVKPAAPKYGSDTWKERDRRRYSDQYDELDAYQNLEEEVLDETKPKFGFREGDSVVHKQEPELGKGKVTSRGAKNVSVKWSSPKDKDGKKRDSFTGKHAGSVLKKA